MFGKDALIDEAQRATEILADLNNDPDYLCDDETEEEFLENYDINY